MESCSLVVMSLRARASNKPTNCPKWKGSPTVRSEPSSKMSEVEAKRVSIHAHSDGSEAEEDGYESNSFLLKSQRSGHPQKGLAPSWSLYLGKF